MHIVLDNLGSSLHPCILYQLICHVGFLLSLRIQMLLHIVFIQISKSLTTLRIVSNRLLIDDALYFENVALVAIKSINARLQCLLNHKFLHNNVKLAPVFNEIGDQIAYAVVDSHLSMLPASTHEFEDVFGRNYALSLALDSGSSVVFVLWFAKFTCVSHVFINKLAYLENVERDSLNHKLLSSWVCVD